MIETIKSTGAESGYFERWAGYFAKQNNAVANMSKFTQYIGTIPSFVDSISGCILVLCGIYIIMQGHFTVGMLGAFQGYLSMFLSPVGSIIDIYQNYIGMRCEMERVEDVLDYPVDVPEVSEESVKDDTKLNRDNGLRL